MTPQTLKGFKWRKAKPWIIKFMEEQITGVLKGLANQFEISEWDCDALYIPGPKSRKLYELGKIRKALEDGIPPSSNFARNRHANLHVAKAMW